MPPRRCEARLRVLTSERLPHILCDMELPLCSSRPVKESQAKFCRLPFPPSLMLERMVPGLNKGGKAREFRCAVVGSDASLLHSGCGRSIDAHDVVFRINSPVLDGFANDVGQRSGITVLNNGLSLYVMDRTPMLPMKPGQTRLVTARGGALLLQVPARQLQLVNQTEMMREFNANAVLGEPMPFRLALYDFWSHNLKARGATERWSVSTGFRGLITALTMCDSVSLFGFRAPHRSSRLDSRYHYWDPPGESEYLSQHNNASPHSFDFEHELISTIASYERIRLCTKRPIPVKYRSPPPRKPVPRDVAGVKPVPRLPPSARKPAPRDVAGVTFPQPFLALVHKKGKPH